MRNISCRYNKNIAQAQINIVPYVDVMLVLIVILLASVSSVVPSIINLPSIAQKSAQISKPIMILVHNNGETSINNTKQNLEEIIINFNKNYKKEQAIVIAGDKEAKYEYIVLTMSKLKQAGFNKVGLLVKTQINK